MGSTGAIRAGVCTQRPFVSLTHSLPCPSSWMLWSLNLHPLFVRRSLWRLRTRHSMTRHKQAHLTMTLSPPPQGVPAEGTGKRCGVSILSYTPPLTPPPPRSWIMTAEACTTTTTSPVIHSGMRRWSSGKDTFSRAPHTNCWPSLHWPPSLSRCLFVAAYILVSNV